MTEHATRVRDALASHADDHEVRRRLHDVPPYEVYEVTVDGRRAVCKLDAHPEGDAATEGRVTAYVDRETSVPVPEVLAVGEDHYLTAYSERVPEPAEVPELDRRGWARAAGAGLATLHAETGFDATGLPAARSGALVVEDHATWADTVRAFLRRRRAYLAGTGHADVAATAIEFVDAHPEAFEVPGEPVLCHGNWLPEHVGIADGGVAAVVDLEHALVAPGEYDYWRTALPAFDGGEDPAAGAFRAGYESVRPLPEGFERRRGLYWLVNGVSYFRSLFLQDRHGPTETQRRAAALRERVENVLDELRERYG